MLSDKWVRAHLLSDCRRRSVSGKDDGRLGEREKLGADAGEKRGREVNVRVEGQCVFNNLTLRVAAALDGMGLAYMPEDVAAEYVAAKRLVRVLEDWCPAFSGYHLYYPSRRQPTAAFQVVLDILRYRVRPQAPGAKR